MPNKEQLEKMYAWAEPHVEVMKAKYPKEYNLDGLEPALTYDIALIILSAIEAHNRGIAEKVERMWTFRAEGKNAIFTPNGLVDKGHVLALLQANKEDK